MSDELDEDQPRYLGTVVGYVSSPARGLKGEPEALTEAEQREATQAAHQRALDERIRRREATADEVRAEMQHLEGRLRFLGRTLRRLARA